MEKIVKLLFNKYWRTLKKLPHVVGFDGKLQSKTINGLQCPIPSFVFYVDTKVPSQYLKNPKKHTLPKILSYGLESIYTDVKAIGKPSIPPILGMSDSTRTRWRPLEAGISSMHEKGTACTLNGFFKTKDGKNLQATNYHCYAMEGDAVVGDALMNPSPYDGGVVEDDKTGEYEFCVPINFDSYQCGWRNFVTRKLPFWTWFKPVAGENNVDISFGNISVDWKNKIALETKGFEGFSDPVVGEPVFKCGRTTDKTKGVWESTSVNIQVQYRRGVVFMTDIAMADLKCDGGDSGSPMYTVKDGKIIYNAALFAGSSGLITKSFGCKISNIINRTKEEGYDIELITNS